MHTILLVEDRSYPFTENLKFIYSKSLQVNGNVVIEVVLASDSAKCFATYSRTSCRH